MLCMRAMRNTTVTSTLAAFVRASGTLGGGSLGGGTLGGTVRGLILGGCFEEEAAS